jgi:hypothetical protein
MPYVFDNLSVHVIESCILVLFRDLRLVKTKKLEQAQRKPQMEPEKPTYEKNATEKALDFNSTIESMKAQMKKTNPELFKACQDCGKSIYHFHQRCDACDRTRWAVMSLDDRMGSLNQDRERLDELQKQIANLSPELQAKIAESSPK